MDLRNAWNDSHLDSNYVSFYQTAVICTQVTRQHKRLLNYTIIWLWCTLSAWAHQPSSSHSIFVSVCFRLFSLLSGTVIRSLAALRSTTASVSWRMAAAWSTWKPSGIQVDSWNTWDPFQDTGRQKAMRSSCRSAPVGLSHSQRTWQKVTARTSLRLSSSGTTRLMLKQYYFFNSPCKTHCTLYPSQNLSFLCFLCLKTQMEFDELVL